MGKSLVLQVFGCKLNIRLKVRGTSDNFIPWVLSISVQSCTEIHQIVVESGEHPSIKHPSQVTTTQDYVFKWLLSFPQLLKCPFGLMQKEAD